MEKMVEVERATQEELRQDLKSLFQGAIRVTLEMVLEEELKAMVGARRFERVGSRKDHRNGTYLRRLLTSLGQIDVMVPRSREGGSPADVMGRYRRRSEEVDEMMVEYVTKIRKAIVRLRHLAKDAQTSSVTISLTAEALQVLVVDEVCSRYGIDPSAILPLKCLSHEIEPPESRLELKQLFAAHTIAVEAIGDDHYHHVWIYTVSARGLVLAESEVKVPIPNATNWGWPEPTKGRPLETL